MIAKAIIDALSRLTSVMLPSGFECLSLALRACRPAPSTAPRDCCRNRNGAGPVSLTEPNGTMPFGGDPGALKVSLFRSGRCFFLRGCVSVVDGDRGLLRGLLRSGSAVDCCRGATENIFRYYSDRRSRVNEPSSRPEGYSQCLSN